MCYRSSHARWLQNILSSVVGREICTPNSALSTLACASGMRDAKPHIKLGSCSDESEMAPVQEGASKDVRDPRLTPPRLSKMADIHQSTATIAQPDHLECQRNSRHAPPARSTSKGPHLRDGDYTSKWMRITPQHAVTYHEVSAFVNY
jgi:hypothetical protein